MVNAVSSAAVVIATHENRPCKPLAAPACVAVEHWHRWYAGKMLFFFFSHYYFPASGQAVVTGVVPFLPPVLAFDLYRT